MALGSERFKEAIEKLTGRRVTPGRAIGNRVRWSNFHLTPIVHDVLGSRRDFSMQRCLYNTKEVIDGI